jgi:probable addiction module antidote protein
MKLKNFDERLLEELSDPEFAAAYLQDAWGDSLEEFLVALRKYIQANDGMSRCAKKAHISREALYRMLSETGNPELRSIRAVLQASGLELSIEPQQTLAAA